MLKKAADLPTRNFTEPCEFLWTAWTSDNLIKLPVHFLVENVYRYKILITPTEWRYLEKEHCNLQTAKMLDVGNVGVLKIQSGLIPVSLKKIRVIESKKNREFFTCSIMAELASQPITFWNRPHRFSVLRYKRSILVLKTTAHCAQYCESRFFLSNVPRINNSKDWNNGRKLKKLRNINSTRY